MKTKSKNVKNKKSVVKKAVKSKAMRKAKTVAVATVGRGRPQIELPIPMDGRKFSIGSVMAQLARRKDAPTRVTVGKRVKELKESGKIKQVDKKFSSSGRGQPIRIYVAVKRAIKAVSQSKKVVKKVNPTVQMPAHVPLTPVENVAVLAA